MAPSSGNRLVLGANVASLRSLTTPSSGLGHEAPVRRLTEGRVHPRRESWERGHGLLFWRREGGIGLEFARGKDDGRRVADIRFNIVGSRAAIERASSGTTRQAVPERA